MENILPIHLQEVIFSSPDPKISKQLTKLREEGKIKKIAARIYTSNFIEPAEDIIKRNIFIIPTRNKGVHIGNINTQTIKEYIP